MSRFGDLLSGEPSTPPVVDATPSSVEPVEDEIEEKVSPKTVNLWNLSKDELEEYGRTLGIELDRRHNKSKLVKQLENYIDGL
tara:strand:+ start:496 stop:744 length:249 start_codon:yes stop_codon:yes gene_type:complete